MAERTLTVATLQMDVAPAPTGERLARAERLIKAAAEAGARLIVLPELFNTGYVYDDANYRRVEPLDGPTVQWMQKLATQRNVHLAGSLLLLDDDDIYNTLLLVAPDGQRWRYNKLHPWAWERCYFRPGHDTVIADTQLGRIGLLICVDVAHTDLWRRYAGQVDLLLTTSSPPDQTHAVYELSDGTQLTMAEMGPLFYSLAETAGQIFGDMVNEQAAWLGVPVIQSGATGRFASALPQGRTLLATVALFAPWLARHLLIPGEVHTVCNMLPAAKIINADGSIATALTQAQGEAFAVAELTLPERHPTPSTPQPTSRVPWYGELFMDQILPWFMEPQYRRKIRKTWGERMAPSDPAARRWQLAAGLGIALGLGLGLLARRRRRR